MQIEVSDLLYGLFISGSILLVVKFINKIYIFKNRRCLSFKKQFEYYSSIEIDEDIVKELYKLIEKYFKVKTCYLYSTDKVKIFYDLSSFDLHENYENFIDQIEKKFKVKVKLEDKLIDIVIKIGAILKESSDAKNIGVS